MGDRIGSLMPRIYHNRGNLIEFLKELEPIVDDLELSTRKLTDLVDVDRCPPSYLVYLASLTNVPLIGDSAALWRSQIKAWPEILKVKGTEKSIRMILSSIDLKWVDIKTYWCDNVGEYVTDEPSGAPYLDVASGLWRNSRTHYFSLSLRLPNGQWLSARDKGVIVELLQRVKPYHSELLYFETREGMFYDSFVDALAEHACPRLQPDLSDMAPSADAFNYSFGPILNESVWPRHYYSEPDLFYDSTTFYDDKNVNEENANPIIHTTLKDIAPVEERDQLVIVNSFGEVIQETETCLARLGAIIDDVIQALEACQPVIKTIIL